MNAIVFSSKKWGLAYTAAFNFAGRIGGGQHTVTLCVVKVIAEIHVSPLSRFPPGLSGGPYSEQLIIIQNNHPQRVE